MDRRFFMKAAAAAAIAPALPAVAAPKLVAGTINCAKIAVGSITPGVLSAIDADLGQIMAGSLDVGTRFVVDADGVVRIKMGSW